MVTKVFSMRSVFQSLKVGQLTSLTNCQTSSRFRRCFQASGTFNFQSHQFIQMATELQPAESDHGLALNDQQKKIVHDCLDLFCSKPSLEILRRSWAPSAHFGDPIAYCDGFDQYAPQWFGMPKLFPKSETLKWNVIKAETNLIEWELTQKYTIRGINYVKTMNSVVHVELDEDGKITKLEDRWGGKELPSNGFSLGLRKMNAKMVPYMVKVPNDDKKTS